MIAVAGGKGGCGKTTTTALLARALSTLAEEPALAVDADLDAPDLHHVADVAIEPGLADLRAGATREQATRRSSRLPGVDVVPAGEYTVEDGQSPASTGSAASKSSTAAQAPTPTAATLDALATRGGPALVDTAAGASPAVTAPLRAADATVLVTTPAEASVRDAAKTAAMARELDAPPLGTVVVRGEGQLDPEPLLDCPTITHVPSVTKPIDDDRTRRAYRTLATQVHRSPAIESDDSTERFGAVGNDHKT